MSPMEMVARELGTDSEGQGSMTAAEYVRSFKALGEHLHDRALEALRGDADDETALRLSQEFCAFSQLVNCFGTALIAYEDMEEAGLPEDDGPPPGLN